MLFSITLKIENLITIFQPPKHPPISSISPSQTPKITRNLSNIHPKPGHRTRTLAALVKTSLYILESSSSLSRLLSSHRKSRFPTFSRVHVRLALSSWDSTIDGARSCTTCRARKPSSGTETAHLTGAPEFRLAPLARLSLYLYALLCAGFMGSLEVRGIFSGHR